MKKILIANRGEIAVRVIRACQELGYQTVAVYSEADKEALHVLLADEAVCIGPALSSDSYLKYSSILTACEITQADAVHPGYGFLSENAKFAELCESCGLIFIGPSSTHINLLGDKAEAKKIAKKVGCPIIKGSAGIVADVEEGMRIAENIGYPVFIKATAGGGGKGIRIAYSAEEFEVSFNQAANEALKAFGNEGLYIEKMIVNPRHIEIQVVGDGSNYIYLGERDCTTQRRRQKLIEEAPSPSLDPKLRKKMGEAAVRLLKEVGYRTVGTVEFLLDESGDFYFMEVNTRVQVEHTITEELTRKDIVAMQIGIAFGDELQYKQSDIEFSGHVFEFRINAENPKKGFMPCPGTLEYYIPPGGIGVRVDSACYTGYKIPPYYDSMIAKLIVTGSDRTDALRRAKRALSEFKIGGIHTTIDFHLRMIEDQKFIDSDYNIGYVDQLVEEEKLFPASD